MKTIIVPIDFSNESFPALNLSLMLSNKTGANIQLIHVLKKYDNSNNELLGQEHQQAEMKFKEVLAKYKDKITLNQNISYTVKEGTIFKEIDELATRFEDVLIVLTTHGESGFEELFLGGNAYKIVCHSKNPVITVRKGNVPSNIKKIILPLDISFQTREKVSYTLELAKIFNSEIHIVAEELSKSKTVKRKLMLIGEQVAAYIDNQKIAHTMKFIKGDNLTDITLDYARSVNADFISIMIEQEKNISNWFLGSYAHQMISKATIPVLLFPNYQLRRTGESFRTEGIA